LSSFFSSDAEGLDLSGSSPWATWVGIVIRPMIDAMSMAARKRPTYRRLRVLFMMNENLFYGCEPPFYHDSVSKLIFLGKDRSGLGLMRCGLTHARSATHWR